MEIDRMDAVENGYVLLWFCCLGLWGRVCVSHAA